MLFGNYGVMHSLIAANAAFNPMMVWLPAPARDMTDAVTSNWIEKVAAAERRGDFLLAFDLASQGLAERPDSPDLRYLATRVLARSGATEQAAALYKHYELSRDGNRDAVMLGARLAKDCALSARAGRRGALLSAADSYAVIYTRAPDPYPAVNAATLYTLAGDPTNARLFAGRALELLDRESGGSEIDRYYRLASRAEAELIRGDVAAARQALRQAATHLEGNFDAAATTRKQLRLVCHKTGADVGLLDELQPPGVLYYRGPTLIGGASERISDLIAAAQGVDKIAGHLARLKIGYAYGSLAAGSEIVCAEACLRDGVELHVVLPFNKDEFAANMTRDAGADWERRFKACLDGAKSVTLATPDAYQDDHSLFSYAGRLAMGMAILRGRNLDAEAHRLDLQTSGWDPDPAGDAAALRMWRARGLRCHRLALMENPLPLRQAPRRQVSKDHVPPRFPRALLFGDVKGFSGTPDHLIPVFQKRVMGAIARVLRRYGRHVLYRNSWGDAIYVVIDDPVVAADCCLAIQDAIKRAKPERYGLSPEMALRLSAHFGPVYNGRDPIRGEPTFFGAPTTLAARMEPVTPPGHVFVTEAMAAAIAIGDAPGLRAEYVGNAPMAKGFGSIRMYSLSREI